jgi:hypothetical protein
VKKYFMVEKDSRIVSDERSEPAQLRGFVFIKR